MFHIVYKSWILKEENKSKNFSHCNHVHPHNICKELLWQSSEETLRQYFVPSQFDCWPYGVLLGRAWASPTLAGLHCGSVLTYRSHYFHVVSCPPVTWPTEGVGSEHERTCVLPRVNLPRNRNTKMQPTWNFAWKLKPVLFDFRPWTTYRRKWSLQWRHCGISTELNLCNKTWWSCLDANQPWLWR